MRLMTVLCTLIVAVMVAGPACGGGSGGGGGSDEAAAGAAANQHIKALLGLFDGSTSGKELLNVFAPECREGVKASDIDAALLLIRAFVPDLAKNKIEAVDLGKLSYEKTKDGINVTATDPDSIRVKVKGKWVSLDDYFGGAGLSASGGSATAGNEPVLLVKRDGKWLIGDCSNLKDFSSPFGSLVGERSDGGQWLERADQHFSTSGALVRRKRSGTEVWALRECRDAEAETA